MSVRNQPHFCDEMLALVWMRLGRNMENYRMRREDNS